MITEKEKRMERVGTLSKNILMEKNPLISPGGLQALFTRYGSYGLVKNESLLLRSSRGLDVHKKDKPKKLVVLISGPSGSGKDTIGKDLKDIMPGQTRKLVTATSRPPRYDEVEGKDYYFLGGVDAFRRAIERDEFLEVSTQGSEKEGTLRLYGVPKQSLIDALQKPEPIVISHVEMSDGWPNVRGFVRSLKKSLMTIRMFILPEMRARDYFDSWIQQSRPNDFAERAIRAGWELHHAPRVADFMIRNRVQEGRKTLTQAAQETAGLLREQLTPR